MYYWVMLYNIDMNSENLKVCKGGFYDNFYYHKEQLRNHLICELNSLISLEKWEKIDKLISNVSISHTLEINKLIEVYHDRMEKIKIKNN